MSHNILIADDSATMGKNMAREFRQTCVENACLESLGDRKGRLDRLAAIATELILTDVGPCYSGDLESTSLEADGVAFELQGTN